jgi:hypothetical protein
MPPALHELQANGSPRLEFRVPRLPLATLDDRESAHHGLDVRGRRTGSLQVCEPGLALGMDTSGRQGTLLRLETSSQAVAPN